LIYFRILSVGFICLFFTACEEPKQTKVIPPTAEVSNKDSEAKITSAKVVQKKPLPTLNLSIDNLSIEFENSEKDFFNHDKNLLQPHSKIFKILNQEQPESDTHISGKILTNKEKTDNKEYLHFVDGVQVNIKGNF